MVAEVAKFTLRGDEGVDGAPFIPEAVKGTERSQYLDVDVYGQSVLDEEILFQGKLSKYHAGFKNNFQPKWIVVTKTALRYYKNQESSVGNAIKPLLAIPICAISSVSKVEFELSLTE